MNWSLFVSKLMALLVDLVLWILALILVVSVLPKWLLWPLIVAILLIALLVEVSECLE